MDILPSATILTSSGQRQKNSRVTCKSTKPENVKLKGSMVLIENKIWIPTKASEMQLILTVIAHTGHADHRGVDATLDILKQSYHCNFMHNDVQGQAAESKSGLLISVKRSYRQHVQKTNGIGQTTEEDIAAMNFKFIMRGL